MISPGGKVVADILDGTVGRGTFFLSSVCFSIFCVCYHGDAGGSLMVPGFTFWVGRGRWARASAQIPTVYGNEPFYCETTL